MLPLAADVSWLLNPHPLYSPHQGNSMNGAVISDVKTKLRSCVVMSIVSPQPALSACFSFCVSQASRVILPCRPEHRGKELIGLLFRQTFDYMTQSNQLTERSLYSVTFCGVQLSPVGPNNATALEEIANDIKETKHKELISIKKYRISLTWESIYFSFSLVFVTEINKWKKRIRS